MRRYNELFHSFESLEWEETDIWGDILNCNKHQVTGRNLSVLCHNAVMSTKWSWNGFRKLRRRGVRRARTYQYLLQESCTIWSLSIMHYDREWSEQGGEESEKHLLLVPSSQQSVVHRFLNNIFKNGAFLCFESDLQAHVLHSTCPTSSETSRPPAKVCSFNGISV